MTDPLDLIRAWDGHSTVLRHDRETGTWIVIAIHDRTLGPPTGGSRMKAYESLADAITDAQRLAAGMSAKWAAIDRPYGGAKAVLMVPEYLGDEARQGLLLRYGDLIAGLEGGFRTGPDMGTTPADMATIAQRAPWVLGIHPETKAAIDPGPFTAQGVFAGIRAVRAHLEATTDLEGLRITVQGVGDVGEPLARLLAAAGAELVLSDIDPARAAVLADQLDAAVVAAEEIYTQPCDVYAPCAVGATLNAETIPRLACSAVAGSANNQLAEDRDAERLADRGVLYAPDFLINAGGALAFADLAAGITDLEALTSEVDRAIETAVADVLDDASTCGITPLDAALRQVAQRLDSA